jgi:hypothetical protein
MSTTRRPESAAVTLAGILSIVYGLLWVLLGAALIFWGSQLLTWLGKGEEAVKHSGAADKDVQATTAAAGGLADLLLKWIIFCGGGTILYGLMPILGGISVLRRTGKNLTLVFAFLAILWGGALVYYRENFDKHGLILASVHFAFGVPALLILLIKSDEFQRN